MVAEWEDNWDCINELNTYSNWCKRELPKIIPNCRKDRLILDLSDVIGFRPSVVKYGPYQFLNEILENRDYSITKSDIFLIDSMLLKYLISNGILNSSMTYKHVNYNETYILSLVNDVNHRLLRELQLRTDSDALRMIHNYWKGLKNILDINISKYFKIPVDHIYDMFSQYGLVGLNSPDEMFDIIARDGKIEYSFIKEIQWMDKIVVIPEVPNVISEGDDILSVKLEVNIFKEGYDAYVNI